MAVYKYEPHAPKKSKAIPWVYCRFCGLLYLSNEPSQQAVKLGCSWREHPSQGGGK